MNIRRFISVQALTIQFFNFFLSARTTIFFFQTEQKTSFFFLSLALIYGSWLFLLLANLFSNKRSDGKKKTFLKSKLMGCAMLTGFALLMFSVSNYGLKEKAVYLNHSYQVSGELTSYHQKMCGGKRKKKRRGRTKKYPCFTRVVSYSPLGSFENFEVKGSVYSRDKDWEIGTPFEVVHLRACLNFTLLITNIL